MEKVSNWRQMVCLGSLAGGAIFGTSACNNRNRVEPGQYVQPVSNVFDNPDYVNVTSSPLVPNFHRNCSTENPTWVSKIVTRSGLEIAVVRDEYGSCALPLIDVVVIP